MATIKLPQLVRDHPFAQVQMPERMIWTASSVKQFRKCKRKFFWKYIMRLRPRYKAGALLIGSAFHEALAEWYRSKRSAMALIAKRHAEQTAQEALVNAEFYGEDEYDKLSSTIQSLTGMLRGYADIYGHDRKAWRIDPKLIEVPFKVDMGTFDFAGKVDLIMTEGKHQKIVEHKTASKIGDSYMERLPLDTQCRAYIFGSMRGLGINPTEIIYDVVRKCQLRKKANEPIEVFNDRIAIDYAARPDFYFYREPLKFDRHDIAAFEHELRQTNAEFEWLIKNGNPLDPRTWTPNDATCNEYFKTCEFMGLCTIGLDKGTAMGFEQGDELHEELTASDD